VTEFKRSILSNDVLATVLLDGLRACARRPWVVMRNRNENEVVTSALDRAAKILGEHPHAHLLERLVQYGPLGEDDPMDLSTRADGPLTDHEAAQVLEVIFASMVNHFKGDLAEIVALPALVGFIESRLSAILRGGTVRLYLGECVRQRLPTQQAGLGLRGADALLIEEHQGGAPRVLGIVEIKSMPTSRARLLEQLLLHRDRLRLGVTLRDGSGQVRNLESLQVDDTLLIALTPSTVRRSRVYSWEVGRDGRSLAPDQHDDPIGRHDVSDRYVGGLWQVRIPASREVLEEAAYAMTYWCLGEIGRRLVSKGRIVGDPHFSQDVDGQNRTKHMLYCLGLRPLTDRHRFLAAKIYNIYAYSYPLAVDSTVMLWPDDFPIPSDGELGCAPRIRDWRGPRTYEFHYRERRGRWRLERWEGLSLTRRLHGLARETRYAVGFHVGLSEPATVAGAVATVGGKGRWHRLSRELSRPVSHGPSPFPPDPYIYRAPIGTAVAKTDRRGCLELRFRIKGSSLWKGESSIGTLVCALNPSE